MFATKKELSKKKPWGIGEHQNSLWGEKGFNGGVFVSKKKRSPKEKGRRPSWGQGDKIGKGWVDSHKKGFNPTEGIRLRSGEASKSMRGGTSSEKGCGGRVWVGKKGPYH